MGLPEQVEPRISVAVMSHPRRSEQASELAHRLGGHVIVDPAPGEDPSPMKTAVHAWAALEPGATHHLVIQDDVVPCDGFLDRVRAGARLFPDSALAFYCNWDSLNGAATRLAAAAGATWAEDTAAEYFPTLATALPARHVPAYLEHVRPLSRWWRDDDEAMRDFLTFSEISAYMSVPSVAEHGDEHSVANPTHGARRAACCLPGPAADRGREALAHSLDHIPWMHAGRLLAMVRTGAGGRHSYLRYPWTTMLGPLGMEAAEVSSGYQRALRRSPRIQQARDELGDLFISSLWTVSYLMAGLLRRDLVPLKVLVEGSVPPGEKTARIGLDTLAAGSVTPNGVTAYELPMRLVRRYWADLAELAQESFLVGLSS